MLYYIVFCFEVKGSILVKSIVVTVADVYIYIYLNLYLSISPLIASVFMLGGKKYPEKYFKFFCGNILRLTKAKLF